MIAYLSRLGLSTNINEDIRNAQRSGPEFLRSNEDSVRFVLFLVSTAETLRLLSFSVMCLDVG